MHRREGVCQKVWAPDCSLPDTLNLPSPIVVAGRATLPVPSCTELCPGESGEEGTCTKREHKIAIAPNVAAWSTSVFEAHQLLISMLVPLCTAWPASRQCR